MSTVVRGLIVAAGVVLMLLGMATLAMPGVGVIGFLQLFGFGALLVIVVAIERQRYRSEAAERSNGSPGPGGGEPAGPLDPRFRPSNEVFIDPTTGVQMRVAIDPVSGERRYVAEV
ncbi:MAG TPA: hypothetical protein VHR16_03250 [Candidatus Limnocylindrales bacterium]|nr:hypothetical protein [Candidatus Limnocylindrales bacterium]